MKYLELFVSFAIQQCKASNIKIENVLFEQIPNLDQWSFDSIKCAVLDFMSTDQTDKEAAKNENASEELKEEQKQAKDRIMLNSFKGLENAMNLIVELIPSLKIVSYSNGDNNDQFWIELYRKSREFIGKWEPLIWIFKKNSETEIGINLKESISDVIGFFLNKWFTCFTYTFVNIEQPNSETIQWVVNFLFEIENTNSSFISNVNLFGSMDQKLESKYLHTFIDSLWKFELKSIYIK